MGEKIAAVDFRGPALGGSLYGQSHLGCGTSTDGGQVDDDRHLSPGGSDRVGTSLAFSLKQELMFHQLCREIALEPLAKPWWPNISWPRRRELASRMAWPACSTSTRRAIRCSW